MYKNDSLIIKLDNLRINQHYNRTLSRRLFGNMLRSLR